VKNPKKMVERGTRVNISQRMRKAIRATKEKVKKRETLKV